MAKSIFLRHTVVLALLNVSSIAVAVTPYPSHPKTQPSQPTMGLLVQVLPEGLPEVLPEDLPDGNSVAFTNSP